MKKLLIVALGAALLMSCSKSNSRFSELKPGEPAYQLAVDLAEKVPFLHPDSNKVLVTTSHFQFTANQLIKKVYEDQGKMAERVKSTDPDMLKRMVLQTAERICDEELIIDKAKETGIVVEQPKLDSLMQMQYKQVGGEEKFMERLQQNDIAIETVRKNLERHLLIQKYLNTAISDQMDVTEEDIQAAYKNKKTATVRHILMLTQGKTEEQKKEIHKKMENVLKLAKRGSDFAKLAQKYSEDPGSKNRGGLYENFGPGQMVKPFEDAAFNLPIGSISDIVETRYGYHIIKVIDRKQETRPIDEIRDELKALALKEKNKKRGEAYRSHIDELRKEANFQAMTL